MYPTQQKDRAILVILDGFGIAKKSPYNAVRNSKMPFFQELFSKYPHSQLLTHGEAVGLPEGIMGNSEVGHMTLGAGRIIYQDLTRINKSIQTKEFLKNPVLLQTLKAGTEKTGRVHLMGLLSDGGVHSHIDHLLTLLDLCVQQNVPNVSVHVILDGRDTPPDSSFKYLEQLQKHPAFAKQTSGPTHAVIASLQGRYWSMDRDKRWERVEKGYLAMTGQIPEFKGTAIEATKKSHESGKTDEFVEPVCLNAEACMKTGDSVIFYNYRSDRAREITTALTESEFTHFDRKRGFKPSAFAAMTEYDKNFKNLSVAFGPQNQNNIFGEWLEQKGFTQYRAAETEKYAHVTFFFSGGREAPFVGEERLLIPSPKEVATYDLKPEMSAPLVTEEVTKKILENKMDFILLNFANADMVGHTGNYNAVVKALETLDSCLKKIVTAGLQMGYQLLITADHGNAEEMRDEQGKLHTQHTLNPVPLIWVHSHPHSKTLRNGGLQDIMPTLCELMKLPIPPEVTGKSLIQ